MPATETREGLGILDVPDLLQGLCDARRSGTLVLQGPGGRAALIYVRKGALGAAWDGDPELLGKAVVKTRAAEWARLEEVLDFYRPGPAALERVLLEQKVATEDQLRDARAFIIREVLADALTWHEARPEFHEGPPVAELVRVDLVRDGFELATKPCLMHAVHHRDEWARFRAVVPSDGDVLRLADGAEVPSTGARQEVLSLLDGRRDVGVVLARARATRTEVAQALREAVEKPIARRLDAAELQEVARGLQTAGGTTPAARESLVRVLRRLEELGALDAAGRVSLAEAFLARGQTEEASRRFLAIGREQLHAEDRSDSTKFLRRALELRPEDGALHRELVQALLEQGALEDAALQAEAYVEWLRARKDPAAVLRATKDLLVQLEDFEEVLILRAELAEAAGSKPEALHLFRRVADARLEGELASQFRLDEKVAALRRVVALDPTDRRTRLRLGSLLADGEPEAALAELEVVLDGARESGLPPAERIAACALVRRLAPERPVSSTLALAHLDAKEPLAAAEVLRAALSPNAREEPGLVPAAEALVAAHDTPDHHDLLARALIQAGDVRRAVGEMVAIAVAATVAGDRERALEALRKATVVDPFDRTARLALAEALARDGNPAERLENLRALVAIARVERDHGLAERSLTEIRAMEPDDPVAMLQLLACRVERGGRPAKAAVAEFLAECEKQGNQGLAAWARTRAQARGALPE